jgi:hypothetical protein
MILLIGVRAFIRRNAAAYDDKVLLLAPPEPVLFSYCF